ncbi:MAG: 6-bladed beta-propeller [Gammaproteobacteria bacterium]|nr:6-bladed beta-propeller [Gammaproteobacteria bacterium]
MRAGLMLYGCALCIALAGCAEPKKTFRISELPDRRDGDWPVWPKGAQIPRFVYVGDLTGEANFVGDEAASRASGFVAWLVGLGREVADPQVLRRPQGVAEGADGAIWVSDVSRQAVFLFDTLGGSLRIIDSFDDTRRFKAPVGLAPLPDGGVIVSDAELGLLVRLDHMGQSVGVLAEGLFGRPTGLAYDAASGRLFVADTRRNRVDVIDLEGQLQYTIGAEGDAAGQLNAPTYIALASGHLYVTDTLNARIQVFDIDGTAVRQIGERGLYVGNLTRPKGVAVSDEGLVFIVESYYDHLLIFDDQGHLLLPIGGTGQRPGQFYLPSGVWAGQGGRVYVADMFNGRVSILQYLGEGQ